MSTASTPEVSPMARSLAARVLPALTRQLQSRKAEFITNAGGFLARQAVKYGWPIAIRELPTAVEAGANALLDEFGAMTLAEVAERLIAHQRQRGRTPQRSLITFDPND